MGSTSLKYQIVFFLCCVSCIFSFLHTGLPKSKELLLQLIRSVEFDNKLYCSSKKRLKNEIMSFQKEYPNWSRGYIDKTFEDYKEVRKRNVGKQTVDTTSYLDSSPVCPSSSSS